jgi:Ca2+-binding EF-hand superfamily protein
MANMPARLTLIALAAMASATAMPLLAQPPEGGPGGGPGGGRGPGGRGDPVQMIMRADANGDGKVTREEFADAQFARMDRNKDGVIDAKDFEGMPDGMAERVKGMVMRADANGDGKVTKEELVKATTPMFDRFDTNHDGAITKEEIETAMAQMMAGGGN